MVKLTLPRIESDLEGWARKQIASSGGLMLKWVSPGTKGVPDNIAFWRKRRGGGATHLVEFKIGDEGLKETQPDVHDTLKALGQAVYVFRSKQEVIDYIARWKWG